MSAELTLGEPLKSRLIVEMAGDLEAMAEHFRRCGMGEEDAVAAAEERLLASPQALEALVRVHTTGLERVAARVAWAVRGGADVVLFLFGMGPLVAAALLAVTGRLGSVEPTVGVEMLLVVAAVEVALVARVVWRLGRGRAARREVAESAIDVLLLAAGTVLSGVTAFLWGMQDLLAGLGRASLDPDAVRAAAEALAGGATVLTLSLLVGLAGALSWFVVTNRLAAAEQAESAALLAD